jgi:hypothetical protein
MEQEKIYAEILILTGLDYLGKTRWGLQEAARGGAESYLLAWRAISGGAWYNLSLGRRNFLPFANRQSEDALIRDTAIELIVTHGVRKLFLDVERLTNQERADLITTLQWQVPPGVRLSFTVVYFPAKPETAIQLGRFKSVSSAIYLEAAIEAQAKIFEKPSLDTYGCGDVMIVTRPRSELEYGDWSQENPEEHPA